MDLEYLLDTLDAAWEELQSSYNLVLDKLVIYDYRGFNILATGQDAVHPTLCPAANSKAYILKALQNKRAQGIEVW